MLSVFFSCLAGGADDGNPAFWCRRDHATARTAGGRATCGLIGAWQLAGCPEAKPDQRNVGFLVLGEGVTRVGIDMVGRLVFYGHSVGGEVREEVEFGVELFI